MAVSLYGLRYKIAAAAVVKSTAARAAHIPGIRGGVVRLAEQLQPAGEQTGSYRGLAAGLLRQAAQERTGGDALVYDPVAGLIPAPQPERAPDIGALRHRAEASQQAADLIALGAAYRKSSVGEFDASAEAYERAFDANPKDLRSVEGLLVSGARSHHDWPRIWSRAKTLKPRRGPLKASSAFWEPVDALFAAATSPQDVEGAAELLADHAENLRSLHQLLIEAISERLQFLGAFSAGARLRRIMAQNRVRELRGIPLESALWLKHLLGAYAYVEDEEKLRRTAARPRVDTIHSSAARQVEKLRADVALWCGDAEPLQRHAASREEEINRAQGAADGQGAAEGKRTAGDDESMRRLVQGKRVAVVGPATDPSEFGELIDSYDTVVRTNLRGPLNPDAAARLGARADISYYAGLDLVRGYEVVSQAVENGVVDLAVTRPHCLPAFPEPPTWLRFARFEFGLYFRGAPMGIQRILYDLLQFAPAEVALFNADFYAGEEVAAQGYRDDALSFGPHSQANDPVVMHDLSFEFRFTQRLARSGLITPHGTAAEVLSLTEQEYLERLQERAARTFLK